MRDEDKERDQLIRELAELRERLQVLEKRGGDARPDAALLESEEKFRSLAERSIVGVYLIQDGVFRYVNPRMSEIFGHRVDEMIGLRGPQDLTWPEDWPIVQENLRKRFSGEEQSIRYEFRGRTKRNEIIFVEVYGTRVTYQGRPAVIGSLLDITERDRAEQALRASEAKYRLVVENACEGILVVQDGMLRFVNPWILAFSGFPEEELLKMPFTDFVYPEDRQLVFQNHLRRMRGELDPSHVYSFRVLTRNGDLRWVEMKGAQTLWEGKPASVNFVFDITRRKEAEDALLNRAEFEKLIMNLSTEFINLEADRIDSGINNALREVGEFIGADRSYVFQFTNSGAIMSNTHEWCAAGIEPQIQNLRNILIDEALPWFARIIKTPGVFHVPSVAGLPPEAGAEKREFERESIQSLLCVPMVYRRSLIGFLGFDAVRTRKTWSDDAIALLRFAGEMLVNALMRKQGEDALRGSEARFRNNFEQAEVGIMDCTLAGGFIWVNRRFCEITGFSAEELRALTFREITRSEDMDKELKDYQEVLQGKAVSYSREKQYVRRDRSLVWVNQTLSLVRDAAGVPKRFVGVVEDITDRKRMEEELLKAQKLESLGVLAGGIAHDFNNVLTAIAGQIAVMRMSLPSGDPLGNRLEEVERSALHAKTLTQQLLTFSKGGKPVKKALSPERMVRDSASLVLSGTSVTYTLTIGESLWSVDADEGQMSQAINNLLINACQAMPDGGSITISAENSIVDGSGDLPLKQGNYVKLTIADQGIGIPPDQLPKIFDPYYTTKKTGSGLGLAVIYSIIRNHGGCILVESRPGTGTIFTVYLPASATTAADALPAEEQHLTGSGRILFMDDEEMIRHVAGEILGTLGYDVEFACEGAEAIERYRKAREEGRPFDAVIMDLTISGGMGGKDTIGKLREYDPGVKAIVSSGYSNDPVMARYGDYGFKDVIAKPYKTAELSRKLHALITDG